MRLPTLVLQSKFKTVSIILEEVLPNSDLMLLQLQDGPRLLSVVILSGVLVMPVSTNITLLMLPIWSMNLLWPVSSTITKRFGPLLKELLFWVGLLLEPPTSTITHWELSTFQHLAQLLLLTLLLVNIILQWLPMHHSFQSPPILSQLSFMKRLQLMLQNSLPEGLQFHTQPRH